MNLNNSHASTAKSAPEETHNQWPETEREKTERSKLPEVQQPKEEKEKSKVVEKPEVQKKKEEKHETIKEVGFPQDTIFYSNVNTRVEILDKNLITQI